ncbi:phosphoribulokinase, chloroplastic-like [Diospyros lotus]|uniref:phosphoribulokinase, chloroplastic-like n=1 Tax=Diospyros lotus TaxID=55363 RepID=UPI00224F5E52|nr:phosphoribulokinase, chloroplastic-like [Diospyros lotus]
MSGVRFRVAIIWLCYDVVWSCPLIAMSGSWAPGSYDSKTPIRELCCGRLGLMWIMLWEPRARMNCVMGASSSCGLCYGSLGLMYLIPTSHGCDRNNYQASRILVIEGLHPMYDKRVRDLLAFSIYLDISNEVKFGWKIQRDVAERGHSFESIKASTEARRTDFDIYIDPQKQYADAVIEVLPTRLIPDDDQGKFLRVRLIMKEGMKLSSPVYLFDEGSTITWVPCGRKLICSYPGIKFFYGHETYFGHEVCVLEMDGQFDRLDELIYIESHLSNISTKFYGELTQQMLKHSDFPGSNNGTGLFQTIIGLKIRDIYEQIIAGGKAAASPLQATNA